MSLEVLTSSQLGDCMMDQSAHWIHRSVLDRFPTGKAMPQHFTICKPKSTRYRATEYGPSHLKRKPVIPTEYARSVCNANDQKSNPIQIVGEELSVNGVKVISTQNGQGKLALMKMRTTRDQTSFRSNLLELALESAGDCGVRPVTNAHRRSSLNDGNFTILRPKFMPSLFT